MKIYRFGPFRLERAQLLLYDGAQALPLGPKVVETLLALIEHPGEILGKSELLDRVWPDGYVEEANLAQNVYVIRKALRVHGMADAIETVPRRGYRFRGDVTVEVTQTHAAEPRAPKRNPAGRFTAIAASLVMLLGAAGAAIVALAGAHAPVLSARGLSPQGARFYAIGEYYWNQRTAPSIAKSERYFDAVIASDPRDGRGYAALAAAYAIAGDYGFGPLSRKAAFARAAQDARKALTLDARSAEAYAVLGLVDVDQHQMRRAFADYRRSLALDPANAAAHQWYGSALLLEGKAALAYSELQKAANLDPESVAATDWLAQAAFVARHYGDALAYGRQTIDLSPQRYNAYQTIGMAYEALGNERAAIAAYETYGAGCKACRYDAAALLARAYALSHDRAQALGELRVAQLGLALHDVSADNLAAALAALGRKHEAIALLQGPDNDEPAALLAIDPRMDALRNDSGFRHFTQSPG